MNKIIVALLFLTAGCNSTQQSAKTGEHHLSKKEIKYGNTITEEELKEHLYIYASDEFEGRETGEPGQKKAVEYLKKQYELLGIPAAREDGEYFQTVPLIKTGIATGNIIIGNNTFEIGNGIITSSAPVEGLYEIVYAGYGIIDSKYSDYSEIDVKDKFVLIKNGIPDSDQLSESTKKWDNWRETLPDRIEIAKQQGAKGILFYDPTFYNRVKSRYDYSKLSNHGSMSIKKEDQIVQLFINEEVASFIYPQIESADQPQKLNNKIELKYENNQQEIDSENVVALLKGTDKSDEYVVISAHLDHIGISPNGEINNGADDDGSGTVSVLEIAEAFKQAKDEGNGPRRSVVFLHVTGEEKGLFGSEYYTDHPIIPLQKTVCDLNIDMIGRIDPKREGNRNYVYLIGSDKLSTELHNLSEEVNKECCNIELDYKYNDENDPNRFYYRSDHYNFAKNNIPIIFYFNGTHDDYHKPGDTPDKINYDLLSNRTKLVFYTAWEVANREKRIEVDKPVEN
ncbi:M28 family peptidase [Abyssalbus ytuae]|uniref:M28 family peptidase n=1 Tax=Abyssalbus ytuae TaxID=2926907 RepID=A0A9E6ZY02_9FLAO|nr:M28 family peptidase [Abyssalbus ytuae]UOB17257.1 M28 family peptidase [Abyssalbus ytuae]